MSQKFSVGISVYNKVEELKLLVSLLKSHPIVKNIYVAATCNEPEIIKAIKQIEISDLIQIKFPYVSSPRPKWHFSITARIFDSQRKLIQRAKKENDFMMHTHGDGWPLDLELIKNHLEEIIIKGIHLAYRGTGLSYRYMPGAPVGEIDDHFYFVNLKAAEDWPLLTFPLESLPLHNINIHGLLALLILSNVGIANSWHYDNGFSWKTWDLSTVSCNYGTPLTPCVFSELLKLLHVHRESFPNNYGCKVQAYYLKNYATLTALNQRPILDFVEKYFDPKMIDTLLTIEKKLDQKLRRRLIKPTLFNRDIIKKEKQLVKYKSQPINSIFYYTVKNFFPRFENYLKNKNFFQKDIYSEYPESILQQISNNLPSST